MKINWSQFYVSEQGNYESISGADTIEENPIAVINSEHTISGFSGSRTEKDSIAIYISTDKERLYSKQSDGFYLLRGGISEEYPPISIGAGIKTIREVEYSR